MTVSGRENFGWEASEAEAEFVSGWEANEAEAAAFCSIATGLPAFGHAKEGGVLGALASVVAEYLLSETAVTMAISMARFLLIEQVVEFILSPVSYAFVLFNQLQQQ